MKPTTDFVSSLEDSEDDDSYGGSDQSSNVSNHTDDDQNYVIASINSNVTNASNGYVIANSSTSDGQLDFLHETFRTISSEYQITVNKMLHDEGSQSYIIDQTIIETVNRRSLHTLRPETWLKDEIINFEMAMFN